MIPLIVPHNGKEVKNLIDNIGITSRANWAAKPRSMTGESLSTNRPFFPGSLAVKKSSKAVIACKAEKQGNNFKN